MGIEIRYENSTLEDIKHNYQYNGLAYHAALGCMRWHNPKVWVELTRDLSRKTVPSFWRLLFLEIVISIVTLVLEIA